MQSENWLKIKEVLDEVLALEVSERDDYLKHAEISSDVRAEVESLLAFEEESENLMHISAVAFSKDFLDDETKNRGLIGQTIGNYRIVRELGYGGMGAVYLAERADGKFSQKVALKLLKREMNTAALRRRFQQEREILASLEHPHIARLLNAGTTDDQIPYIAMEYVEGLPIDDYSNKNNLDLNQRLDLFRKVCSAVGFAHRNLIVHRDLKPSNILVNDEGLPKLLDFGISKILSNELDKANLATVTRLGVMTPSYASPEQLRNKSVTTATDIYSLGVILYELLSGHRPFENREADLKEIYQAVLEDEPLPPSVLIHTISKSLKDKPNQLTDLIEEDNKGKTGKNKNPRTTPQTVSLNAQSLRGDLDNIVLKALRKEPERRYSSAENFAEDIHRHQRGLPVTARPNTLSYRAEKFFKRNRASVVGGFLLVLAVFGGIIATLWQAQIARAERAKAEKRFNDVRALANSFLFEITPQIENLTGSMAARELLVKRALEYLDNLSTESENDYELQRELAAAYQKVGDVQGNPNSANIGDTEGALESYRKSMAILENLLSIEPNNLKIQDTLASLYKVVGDLHNLGGDYSEAAKNVNKAVELRENIVAQNPNDFDARSKLTEAYRTRGLVDFYDSKYSEAISFYKRAQDLSGELQKQQPENPKFADQYAYSFVLIGEAQGWDNDPESAAKTLQTGLDLIIPLSEKYPNDIGLQRSAMLAYSKRGENYSDLEQFDKSLEHFSAGLKIAENLLKADPKSFQAKRDVALMTKKVASDLDSSGKSRESLEKLNYAHTLFKEMSTADPSNTEYLYDVANTKFSIGETYITLKDFESALEIFQKANDEFKIVLDKNPSDYVKRLYSYSLYRIGTCHYFLSNKGKNKEFWQKSLEYLNSALENFKKMQAEGDLSGVDESVIGDVEKKIEIIKSRVKS